MAIHFQVLVFFLLIRRPPRPTLFPTRRSSDLVELQADVERRGVVRTLRRETLGDLEAVNAVHPGEMLRHGARLVSLRSEEHTSELQSQSKLVCRLLLEKKKKQLKYSKR